MEKHTVRVGLGGGSLLQMANRTPYQMMGYIADSPDGKTLVTDGGYYKEPDADNLYSELEKRGKHVSLWIITHAHQDHFGALLKLMERASFDITVDALLFNFPSDEWLSKKEDYEEVTAFLTEVKRRGINVVTPHINDVFSCGALKAEIISEPLEYEKLRTINSTSIIFKLYFPKREVLFLGDFDVFGQENFMKHSDPAKLRCDIVQMAHHGQNGVDKSFYELIKPKICLYTAPKWLWENNFYKCDNPETAGKGPFAIMETRKWMEELGAESSYGLFDGDCVFV